ncbi:uncharacterized protein [Dysidea avara]|uniref:uncharacterized protein isoform X3 n=1 Tax=Dysidea avara TaxID=196820 RepID=UPI00332CC661
MASSSPDKYKRQLRERLQNCWALQFDWTGIPETLKKGCEQVGSSLNVPPAAVLCGYMQLCSHLLSPAVIKIPKKDWVEPILLWMTIVMPTGSGKSTLYRHLLDVLRKVQLACQVSEGDPSWMFDDGSFEKMGCLMSENGCILIGIYDELSAFLSQLNLYRGKGLLDTHEMSVFLQLYNGLHWKRDTVSGESNFAMPSTFLTVGGFTQPCVARNVMESSSTERGFSHRFMWMCPKPMYQTFSSLGEVNKSFIDNLVELFSTQWREQKERHEKLSDRVFQLSENYSGFAAYYDEIQLQLERIAGIDESLSGLLSKSRGQVLRMAAVLHVLFTIKGDDVQCEDNDRAADGTTDQQLDDGDLDVVHDKTVKVAINIVRKSIQHSLYMTGRCTLTEEISKAGEIDSDVDVPLKEKSASAVCLTAEGKKLYLQPLVNMKRFRYAGNKSGAVMAVYQLEKEGLGKVIEITNSKGVVVHYEFEKAAVPQEKDAKIEFAKKLSVHEVSLTQYEQAYAQPDIVPIKAGVKRKTNEMSSPTRQSPRK